MTCADNDYAEMAKYLIECGANVNETMSSGWTAMHTAAKKKNAKVLKVFLTNGGNQHLKARHREFGSNLAVADVAKDSQNIQELLQKYSN